MRNDFKFLPILCFGYLALFFSIMSNKTTFVKVKEEQGQGLASRKNLYRSIEKEIGRPVISYCTSFSKDVLIDDNDATMLEDVLRTMSLDNGIALFINSPGGYGLAAERIIQILREYSDTGEYISIVAGKAKSAATMICLGSSKILMSSTSELGPVDPQVEITQGNSTKVYSVFNLIRSYKELFQDAIKEKGI